MNLQQLNQKKQELIDEFNKNSQYTTQLNNRNQQIIGQLQIIEELAKEESPKTEEVKEGDK